MTSFYKYLLSVFCFTCVSAFATPATVVPTTQLNNYIVKPAYIIKPDFKIGSFGFPACDCDKQGKPLSSCQEKTITTVMEFIVDKEGTVQKARMIKKSGNREADNDLLTEIYKTKFSPALENNMPIPFRVRLPVTIKYEPIRNPSTCPIEKLENKESLK